MEDLISKQKIEKRKTGIQGLDEVTEGGFPFARPTLVSGYAGSGKTVLAMQFILNGILLNHEPGVFISLEESEEDLRQNMASFGYDLRDLEQKGLLVIENIKIKHAALYQSGTFDLTPIFLRIEEAVSSINAKRIAIDTFELIFNDIQDANLFRQELVRLTHWLKEKSLTAVFTSETPSDTEIKSGIEEFITDCVITLKHQVVGNVYTRRLHVLKYRGSNHGTNEYPFLINENGIVILPITTPEIDQVSTEILPTGVRGLDGLIEKKGFYLGSTTLISGTSGVGKTSVSFSFCINAMKKGKKCLYFSFEESRSQLKRNMKSIGFDLEEFEKSGLLQIISTRPTLYGLETHLVKIYRNIEKFQPELIVFDPVTDLMQVGERIEVRGMLLRIIDSLKSRLITVVFAALINSREYEQTLGMSSLVDNWIEIITKKTGSKRLQTLNIIKVRGMKHSHDEYILEFSNKGLSIKEFEEI